MQKPDPKPPKLGLFLFKKFLNEEFFAELFINIEEEFLVIARQNGLRKAKLWYWQQVVESLPVFLKDRANGSLFYFKTRTLTQIKKSLITTHTVQINILVLSAILFSSTSIFIVTCSKSPTAPNLIEVIPANNHTNNLLTFGTKIAFTSESKRGYDIFVVNPDGSQQINLTKNFHETNYDPSWSPDGRKIVFASGGNFKNVDEDMELYIMNDRGRSKKQLTRNEFHDRSPSWSPDGERIVFESYRNHNWDIFVIDADGTNEMQLTYSYAHDVYPAWSPDGSTIAFVTERHYPNGIETEISGNWEIYTINLNDLTSRKRLTQNNVTDNLPTFSPDGSKLLYYSGIDGNFEIYTMNIDGSKKTRLTFRPEVSDYHPFWSPDGSQIVFQSGVDGGNFELFTMKADGSEITKITDINSWIYRPAWSPIIK